MMAEHLAGKVYNLATMLFHEIRLLEKFAIVVIRHETNLHALFLVGGPELAMARDLASVALGLVAEWKQGAGQLLLPE